MNIFAIQSMNYAFALVVVIALCVIIRVGTGVQLGGGGEAEIPYIKNNSGGPLLGSNLEDFDVEGRSNGAGIYAETSWSYRYLSKYYTSVIIQLINEYMKQQLSTATSLPTAIGGAEVPPTVPMREGRQGEVDGLLKYIDMRIGIQSFFLPVKYYTGIDQATGERYATFIVVKNRHRYPTKLYYSDPEATEMSDPLITLKFNPSGALIDWGVKFTNYLKNSKAVLLTLQPLELEQGYTRSLNLSPYGESEPKEEPHDEEYEERYLAERERERKMNEAATCFKYNKYTGDLETVSLNQLECLSQGGIWDTPCTDDSSCGEGSTCQNGYCSGRTTFRY
jgi:hypothetical protein